MRLDRCPVDVCVARSIPFSENAVRPGRISRRLECAAWPGEGGCRGRSRYAPLRAAVLSVDCYPIVIELTRRVYALTLARLLRAKKSTERVLSPVSNGKPPRADLRCPGKLIRDVRVFGGRVALGLALVTAASALRAEPMDEAVERYRGVMITDMDRALAGARALRERLAANDIPGAKEAWIDARVGWERSEVFTGAFIPDLDDAIDAWPDATRGFHGVEAKLFGAAGADVGDAMDGLVRDLTAADKQVHDMPLTRQGLLNGLARLAYEIGDSKVDGGESRLSGTSLDDMRNNADGIELAYGTLFASALAAADVKLDAQVRSQVSRLNALLAAKDLRSIDPEELQKASEVLVVTLSAAAPKLGLETPTLEGGPNSTGAVQ